MSQQPQQKVQDEAPASLAQTPPPPSNIGYGHPEYQFVSSIMEMQKTLGEINSSIRDLSSKIDSTAQKVDNLYQWKHMILGGAVVIGVGVSGAVWLFDYLTDNYQFTSKSNAQVVDRPVSAPQLIEPAPEPKKK